MPISNVLEPY
jgi:hypothetical protein